MINKPATWEELEEEEPRGVTGVQKGVEMKSWHLLNFDFENDNNFSSDKENKNVMHNSVKFVNGQSNSRSISKLKTAL